MILAVMSIILLQKLIKNPNITLISAAGYPITSPKCLIRERFTVIITGIVYFIDCSSKVDRLVVR